MDPDKSLQSSFWVMVLLQTLGSVDAPGKGNRKMPAPRVYLAVVVTWAVLQILADTGRERAASVVGWAMVIAGITVGPFGQRVINLINSTVNLTAPNTTGNTTP